MAAIILNAKGKKTVLRHHPWIFSGAVEKVEGTPQSGETVEVRAKDNALLGYGAYSPESQIRIRMWSFNPDQQIDPDFFREKLKVAIQRRQEQITKNKLTGCRLVAAESDGLPGIVIDQFGDYLVGQFLSAGAEYWKSEIVKILDELINPKGIYERSDVAVRKKEGLKQTTGLLSGEMPPEELVIQEDNLKFLVDVYKGHKTGFYFDQRESRSSLAEFAKGKSVLNCFSYTGGFGMAAAKAGASHLVNVDASRAALEACEKNIELNQLDESKIENIEADVFALLRGYRDEGKSFDIIILDPPKFAESKKQLPGACRGYKDINLLAMKLLKPGGLLFTFSCSGLMTTDLFQKIVADAALDAGKNMQIIRRLFQAADHPTSLNFPEGTYLKGFVCQT